jgi:hypothetical protein
MGTLPQVTKRSLHKGTACGIIQVLRQQSAVASNERKRNMKYRTFKEWAAEKEIELVPDTEEGGFSGQWFVDREIPMVVVCTRCTMSMTVMSPTVRIDDKERVFCKNCVQ